jgi:CBS domain-containing protein
MPVVDDMAASGPLVRDDMTVEVALSVMAGAGVEYLILCDEDDQCTGLITRTRLAVLRDSTPYTDRIRLRDVLDGSLTSPDARPGAAGSTAGPGASSSSPRRSAAPDPVSPFSFSP